jgi:hypothetical protein
MIKIEVEHELGTFLSDVHSFEQAEVKLDQFKRKIEEMKEHLEEDKVLNTIN